MKKIIALVSILLVSTPCFAERFSVQCAGLHHNLQFVADSARGTVGFTFAGGISKDAIPLNRQLQATVDESTVSVAVGDAYVKINFDEPLAHGLNNVWATLDYSDGLDATVEGAELDCRIR